MTKPRFQREKGVLYCASCGSFGVDEEGHAIGTPFQCPNDNTHFAEVVKSPSGEFWLRIEQRIWKLEQFSPLNLLHFGGRAGVYHLFRSIAFVLLVLIADPHGSWFTRYVPVLLSIYLLYDAILLSTFATFVSRYPAHPLRSLVLNLSAFFQCGLGYAVIFKIVGDMFSHSLTWIDSIYFSIVTIATVGFGDIAVSQSLRNRWYVEILIISEIAIGLYMLAGLIAVVASWANQRPDARQAQTLDALRTPYQQKPLECVPATGTQPTIAVDFDGVIANYNGWEGTGTLGAPRIDVIEALKLLREEGWKIVIYSCRTSAEIAPYLLANAVPFDEINKNSSRQSQGPKPAATVYWDDRAYCYSGDARKDLDKIRNFRTWNGRR